MTITEKFQNKRCVFSIECFPPKQTTQMDKMKTTLQSMRALNPDFISVTFGAGGSAGGVLPSKWPITSSTRSACPPWPT